MLLFAPQYATPQRRRRLFVVAAKSGVPLPDMPQPLSTFQAADKIRQSKHVQISDLVAPERSRWPLVEGVADDEPVPAQVWHSFESLESTIGDLHSFDW